MYTLDQFQKFMEELPSKLKLASEIALTRSALFIESTVSKLFKTEGRSLGVTWRPLKEAYLKQKIKKGYSEKILHRTTTLAQSFTHVLEANQVKVGTPVLYAKYHEYGTRKMPARPFLQPALEHFLATNKFKQILKTTFNEVIRV